MTERAQRRPGGDVGLAWLDSLRAYVEFTERDQELLRELLPIAQPFFTAISEDFYAAIAAHPDARAVFTGGSAQVERLKHTLTVWMGSVLEGPYDARYLEQHARIGRVHVRIGLPQQYMFTAMNRIRSRLLELAFRHVAPARAEPTALAVGRILDIELAIMLDAYREDLNARVRASERLATIGQLAASIGHELRNPLGIIESSMYLMRARFEQGGYSDPGVEKHASRVEQQVKNCAKIITNLLELARDTRPTLQVCDLGEVVEHALGLAALGDEIEVLVTLPQGISAHADPLDLAHVLSNLLVNGAQAQNATGKLWIEARDTGDGTEIVVRDEGPGVPADLRDRIFDALYTTKARGTGLGLALCRRIVSAHGGEIGVADGGPGAVFRVWLPTRAGSVVEAAEPAAPALR
ncbi:MAG: histidine kinase [Polyangiaceae bacterium]|nr:histidine kinase [Polyangiaceae bacterium]